jgi:hypothetical protein
MEIKMPAAPAKPEVASSFSSDPDLDRLRNDPQNVARTPQARPARDPIGRRRPVDPATCEREFAAAEQEFMQAMQEYKQRSGRMFPTWSEVLEVLVGLGYEKTTGDRAVPGAGSSSGLGSSMRVRPR